MSITYLKKILFRERLLDFFKKSGREHLPWRKSGITAYEVWVSEIMLQQTQVNRVLEYYTRFLKRFPTVESLAKATWEDFLPYYAGLGYYVRGRNMLKTAQIVHAEHGGKFPRDKKTLEGLAGIGPYTASAIMSFAFGDKHLAWDTNLKRVLGRFFLGGKQLLDNKAETMFEKIFNKDAPWLNAALMDFGSSLCVARPKCGACMFRDRCVYYREKGKKEMYDARCKIRDKKEKNKNWKEAQVYVFLHEKHRQYYSSNRKSFKPFALSASYNTRAGIKQYFQEKYGLTLSVRPPHKKEIIGEKLTLFVNAQILLGEPKFCVFPKNEAERYNVSKLNS
jgi:A/G-specific adenine glycosylase